MLDCLLFMRKSWFQWRRQLKLTTRVNPNYNHFSDIVNWPISTSDSNSFMMCTNLLINDTNGSYAGTLTWFFDYNSLHATYKEPSSPTMVSNGYNLSVMIICK